MKNKSLHIRRARLTDVATLVALETQTFHYSQLGARAFRRFLRVKTAHTFVLVDDDDQILGYSLLLSRRNSRQWRLYSIAISAACRGLGAGKLLLEHALNTAYAQGATAMSLEVKTDNAAAIALYQRYDFAVVDLLLDYYPGHGDGYRMRRSLSDLQSPAPPNANI